MRKFLLLFSAFLGAYVANADNWTLIGTGYYEDPLWVVSGRVPLSGPISVEESNETPGLYRFKHLISRPSSEYMYIHCEDKNRVYVEEYKSLNSNNNYCFVSQLCKENNWDESLANNYGSLIDKKVTIGGNAFACYIENEMSNWQRQSSERQFVFRLPSEGDANLHSGIYFGITAFNHMPKFMPIKLLGDTNREQYHNFVNSQNTDDYTFLYYSVDKSIDALAEYVYPKDLNSVALITFTDGNDDGSLEVAPDTSWDDVAYQRYVKNKIKNTIVQGHKLEAFSIGLKGEDIGDYNYDLFKSNLLALASDDDKASEVSDMGGVERTLNAIIDKLQTSWLNKKIEVRINMRASGDRIRFTLDKSRAEMSNNPDNSDLWIEGVFSRDDLSLNNVIYHGFTSTSGERVVANKVTVDGKTKYQFTFENLRDKFNNELQTGEIHFWHKNASTPAWQPHTEFGGSGDVNSETEFTSAAIMLVMDCSSSLGNDDFNKLQDVVNSLIDRLANRENGIANVMADDFDAPEEYYNLQGLRVEHPSNGIFICRKGNTVKKVFLK